MKCRSLGKSGLRVSEASLGTMTFATSGDGTVSRTGVAVKTHPRGRANFVWYRDDSLLECMHVL
jgi:aryl-alcohol dehydrogenase-like predicted oxidoreductase